MIQRLGLAGLVVPVLFAAASQVAEFRNVASSVGLTHSFPNGGNKTKTYILETTGSGAAFIDYNNDDFLDIFLVSGEGGTNRLYRNTGKGRFIDVTEQTGLQGSGWGQGVCAADYNNDGYVDLFVTYWGQTLLYENDNGRRFRNVTGEAGLTQKRIRYNTGCAFLDYDRDGDVDLFVANYLKFEFQTTPKPGDNPYCFYRDVPVACGPRGLPFDTNLLYRNEGDSSFTDVSKAAGISDAGQGYALGVLTGDFDDDGWTDIYVACDRTPSILYINNGDGTFSEEALLRGVALDENGAALSGMGVAAADYDGDGRLDIFRTNFSDERASLYRSRGQGDFDETTMSAGMGHNTQFVGWGCGFIDFDNDSWPDVLLVNGHVFPEVDKLETDIRYREPAILYRNLGQGRFADVSAIAGPALVERHSARGAAFGDYDNDGLVDIIVNNQNEPPTLFKQTSSGRRNWILLKLIGIQSNRSAIGGRVKLTTGKRTQTGEVRSGGSYLSHNDLRLHFGLGDHTQIDKLEVSWPSGTVQVLSGLKTNRQITIRERQSTDSRDSRGEAKN